MKNSQEFKLNPGYILLFLFLIISNIFLLTYLIINQLDAVSILLITIETVVGGIYILMMKISLRNNSEILLDFEESLENTQNKYEKTLKELNQTMGELKTSNGELKALNLQLIKSKKELQETSEYRGKFLVNVSHELRTPLNAIIGFTTIMNDEDYTSDRDFKDMLKVIYESSKRLLTLINNILNIAKIETSITEIVPQRINLNGITSSLISVAKGLLRDNKKIILTHKIDENISEVMGDEKNLSRALVQFIDNAVKYTQKGEIKILSQNEDNFVRITISDTGFGISETKLKSIQEPFISQFDQEGRLFSLDSTEKGYNLAISKYIIEKMGGIFLIDSTENYGTTIVIKLRKVNQ